MKTFELRFLVLLVGLLLSCRAYSQTFQDIQCKRLPEYQQIKDVGSEAEWFAIREVLVHTPGEELFLGVIHPDAALFERTFSPAGAANEHKEYINKLLETKARVHTVVETLLAGTDKEKKGFDRQYLEDLKKLARRVIWIIPDSESFPFPDDEKERKKQEEYLSKTLSDLGELAPEELVKIIIQQPYIRLKRSIGGINTGYAASYGLSPLMNLYFTRDQVITTKKGVVVGIMNSEQRREETEIIKFVLCKLGIDPIYTVKGEGRFEGGDFLPAKEQVFIGQGLRTNAEAIKQLLDNDVFGVNEVVVVKDEWKQQQELHLDTYFNIIDRNLVVLVEDRYDRNCKVATNIKCLKADIWTKQRGVYKLTYPDVDFVTLLEKREFHVIPVSVKDQEAYGINFLTKSSRQIFALEGVSEQFKNALQYHRVVATWLDWPNMTGGYGAAHCTVQVLRRDESLKVQTKK